MFIAIVLTTSSIFALVASLLWKQFITNKKKRQQRLRSLSSRLPKLQSNSSHTLEQRRLKVLCNRSSHDKHVGVTGSDPDEYSTTNNKTSASALRNEYRGKNYKVKRFSSDESSEIIYKQYHKQDEQEKQDENKGYASLEQFTAPMVPSVYEFQPENEPEPEPEIPPSLLKPQEPPALLPVPSKSTAASSIKNRGYSLLETFLKKKKDKNALKGYSIFTGSSSDNELTMSENLSPAACIVRTGSDLTDEDENSLIAYETTSSVHIPSLAETLAPSKLPDSYKYINKKPLSHNKKLECYKNPYQLSEDLENDQTGAKPQTESKNENPEPEPLSRSVLPEIKENSWMNEAPYIIYNEKSPFLDKDENPKQTANTAHPTSLHKKKNSAELKRKQAIYKSLLHSGDKTNTELCGNDPRLQPEVTKPQTPPEINRIRSCTTEGMLRISEEHCRNRDIVSGDNHDAFDHLLDGVDLHDWNERFQRIMTTIRKFNTNTTIALQIKANRALIHLAQDFIYASSTYGKIIISEVYSAEKTIKPINLGGKLGGTKYIVQNILFKFAVDESGLYSDYAAAKVAGHEIKGLINYFNCNIEDLCLPLMSLVDYRGFRLIAMSILPIRGSESIIYGSDNYGETIHNKNPAMRSLLKRAARMMNIKEHRCGISHGSSNLICSPADLEGHVGTDGRLYLLDFSRVLPPETPVQGIQNAHLYRLLRPEHVKLFYTPLCSDAFSGFIRKFNYHEDNNEIKLATQKLINETIPQFATDLTGMMIEARNKGELESFRLTEAIHRQGINVRYIGLLRTHIKELDPRTFLLVEMSARIVKNKLRKVLRKKMKELKVPLEEPYRRLVISYLNLVLGDSEASEDYWNNNLKKSLQRTFVEGLSTQESNAAYSLKSSLNNFSNDRVDGKLLLFLRLQKMTGLRFTNRINDEFTQNPNNWAPRGAQPLDETDLEDIGLRVKHMNIVSHAQGFVLQMKGAMAWAHDPIAAERFYNMAITKYEEALDTNPNDYQALIRCAEIATQFIEGHARGVAAMKYNIEMPQVQYANMLYQRAVTANPNDSYGLYRYAQFLDKCNIPQTAEEMFLRSLEADPENMACLHEYGNFLSENSKHDIAELFFVRGSELAQKYSTTHKASDCPDAM